MPTCAICGHQHECPKVETEKQEKLPAPPYSSYVDLIAAELEAKKNPGKRVVDMFSKKTNTCLSERYAGSTSDEAALIASQLAVGGEPVTVINVYEPAVFRAKKPDGA